jgi:hypothetical protein
LDSFILLQVIALDVYLWFYLMMKSRNFYLILEWDYDKFGQSDSA